MKWHVDRREVFVKEYEDILGWTLIWLKIYKLQWGEFELDDITLQFQNLVNEKSFDWYSIEDKRYIFECWASGWWQEVLISVLWWVAWTAIYNILEVMWNYLYDKFIKSNSKIEYDLDEDYFDELKEILQTHFWVTTNIKLLSYNDNKNLLTYNLIDWDWNKYYFEILENWKIIKIKKS